MRGRDRVRRAEGELVEFGGHDRGVHALGLVDRDPHARPEPAQLLADAPVLRRKPVAAVDEEDHGVGLGERAGGLFRHRAEDSLLGHRLEAAGVDHEVRAIAHHAVAVVAIAGEARQVGDERVADCA